MIDRCNGFGMPFGFENLISNLPVRSMGTRVAAQRLSSRGFIIEWLEGYFL
ncbi:MAG: hypothetical protein ACHQXK_04745 [Methanosarcina thermophila]